MTALLDAFNLTLTRGGRTLCAGLNLSVMPGDHWAILGRNGAGKTTLLHALAGLDAGCVGAVHLSGQAYSAVPARQAARLRGLLRPNDSDGFDQSVLETALIGRHPHVSRWRFESAADIAIAREALAAVGLETRADQRAATLSSGERGRLAIATLLTQAPPLMLLDEPLAHLDVGLHIPMLSLILARARASVMVMHDPSLAWRFCNRALVMFEGGAWQSGPARDVITTDTLGRLHGHAFRMLCDGTQRVFVPD